MSTFCTWGEEEEEEEGEDCKGCCQPYYREAVSLFIKFIGMQFVFSNVLGFSSGLFCHSGKSRASYIRNNHRRGHFDGRLHQGGLSSINTPSAENYK